MLAQLKTVVPIKEVPDNIQQLRTAIEDEGDNIPQTTINSLITSM